MFKSGTDDAEEKRSAWLQCLHTDVSLRRRAPFLREEHNGISGDICLGHRSTERMCAFRLNSATGTRTRVARVRAEYPNQLDYSGCCIKFDHGPLQQMFRDQHMPVLSKHVRTPLLTFRPTLTPTRCQWLCCHAVVARILTAHRFNELGFWPDVYFPRAWHPIAVPHMLSSRTSCFLKSRPQLLGFVGLKYGMPSKELQNKCLHFSICACHPCAGAMLILSVRPVRLVRVRVSEGVAQADS